MLKWIQCQPKGSDQLPLTSPVTLGSPGIGRASKSETENAPEVPVSRWFNVVPNTRETTNERLCWKGHLIKTGLSMLADSAAAVYS